MFTRIIITLILVVSLISAPALAQQNGTISFTWGDVYKLPAGHGDLGFIGNGEQGYMQIGHAVHKSLSLQKFSPAMKLIDERTIDLDKMPKDYTNELIVTVEKRNYWIFSTWEDKQEHLFIQEIDLNKTDFTGSAKEVITTDKLSGDMLSTGPFSLGIGNKYRFYLSGNGSKMLVKYRKRPEKKSDKVNHDVIGFTVFDASMKLQWQREIRMPYTEEKMDNDDYHVDNNGNIYTLAKIFNSTRGDKKDPLYHYEILKWSNDKAEVTKIPFHFTDKYVRHAMLSEDKNGRIIVAGYYSNLKSQNYKDGSFWGTPKTTSVNGAFILALNGEELKDIYKGSYEFPTDVLKEYESRRTKRKLDRKDDEDEAEAENMSFTNFVINTDGSVELYGEEQYYKLVTHSSGRTTYSTPVFFFNDIIVMKIAPDGNLKWVKKIPKNQKGVSNPGGLSFIPFNYEGNSYLFYFDNEKNLDITPDETPYRHTDGSGGILMAVKIDAAGNVQKTSVFNIKEEKMKLIPRDLVRISNNEMITRAWGKKGSQIALFTFGKQQ